jgi:hypothetical protein
MFVKLLSLYNQLIAAFFAHHLDEHVSIPVVYVVQNSVVSQTKLPSSHRIRL